jgi:hypothetical protein
VPVPVIPDVPVGELPEPGIRKTYATTATIATTTIAPMARVSVFVPVVELLPFAADFSPAFLGLLMLPLPPARSLFLFENCRTEIKTACYTTLNDWLQAKVLKKVAGS